MMKLTTISMITLSAAFLFGCSSGSGSAGGTGGSGNTTSTGGSGNSPGTGGGTQGGNPGQGGSTTCTNTNNSGIDAKSVNNGFFSAVYGFGDGDKAAAKPSTATDPGTTFCLDSPTSGKLCMNGLGQEACGGSSPCDYHRWGAGIGLNLAKHDDTAKTVTPFNATAAGVTGVSFTITGAAASPIRVQMTMVDDPATATINEGAGFVYGGGTADVKTDGTVTAQFTDFAQPAWGCVAANTASNPCGSGQTLTWDATKVDALQFQVPTVAGSTTPYDFCVSDIKLVDATGKPVTPPAGAGGSGAGGAAP